MKRMTPACKLVWFSLRRKDKYFRKRNMLDKDGLFYYDDKRLVEELGVSVNTIRRAKRTLQKLGHIQMDIGRNKGRATRYWVSSPKPTGKIPFEIALKPAKILSEGIKIVSKAYQEGIPNKERTKEINNEGNKLSIDKDCEEGIRKLAKSLGDDWVISHHINKGYDKKELERILKSSG